MKKEQSTVTTVTGEENAGNAQGQNERPILFSGPMVRAILEDHKTQTQRIVKPQPPNGYRSPICYPGRGYRWTRDRDNAAWPGPTERHAVNWLACPYGVAGDRLWVRETFALHDHRDPPIIYYRADNPQTYESDGAWRPSIHMPRWASRITLEITGVRVERLQDISYDDCIAEGIKMLGVSMSADIAHLRLQFRDLWDSINGKGAWDKNPWCWVIEFKRVRNDAEKGS